MDEEEDDVVKKHLAQFSSTMQQSFSSKSSSSISTRTIKTRAFGKVSSGSSSTEEKEVTEATHYSNQSAINTSQSGADTSRLTAAPENPRISRSPMTYLSASSAEDECCQQRRSMSRSLSPMSSTSSDGAGAFPSKTLSTAKSVDTSSIGREGRQWLTTARSDTAKSMESLRSHHRHSFINAWDSDVRRVVASSVEARSLESLQKEMIHMSSVTDESSLSAAEKRRGLFAGVLAPGERTAVPQHLSLPPPGAYLTLATPGGDRRLTILSPHSPHQPDFLQFASSSQNSKSRRKKAIILPKLVLPRSESEVFMPE